MSETEIDEGKKDTEEKLKKLEDILKKDLDPAVNTVVEAAYSAIDTNGDESIQFSEIDTFLKQNNISGDYSRLVFALMGGTKLDSTINKEQFKNFFKLLQAIDEPDDKSADKDKKNKVNENELLPFVALYQKIDLDNSHSIELSELRNYFNLLNVFVTDEELRRIFDEIDEDGNKSLSLQEILDIINIVQE